MERPGFLRPLYFHVFLPPPPRFVTLNLAVCVLVLRNLECWRSLGGFDPFFFATCRFYPSFRQTSQDPKKNRNSYCSSIPLLPIFLLSPVVFSLRPKSFSLGEITNIFDWFRRWHGFFLSFCGVSFPISFFFHRPFCCFFPFPLFLDCPHLACTNLFYFA